MKPYKKVVAIGPESTGKSTLCAALAAHFGTEWVPEYARQYLQENPSYTYTDLLDIAKGQLHLEDAYANRLSASQEIRPQTSPYLFIDTDMYVMQVWCEYVYNDCHNWILRQIASRQYDGYLLCDVDLPWEEDGMREYPDLAVRQKLFHYYKELMVSQAVPWTIIRGAHEQRVDKAISFIQTL